MLDFKDFMILTMAHEDYIRVGDIPNIRTGVDRLYAMRKGDSKIVFRVDYGIPETVECSETVYVRYVTDAIRANSEIGKYIFATKDMDSDNQRKMKIFHEPVHDVRFDHEWYDMDTMSDKNVEEGLYLCKIKYYTKGTDSKYVLVVHPECKLIDPKLCVCLAYAWNYMSDIYYQSGGETKLNVVDAVMDTSYKTFFSNPASIRTQKRILKILNGPTVKEKERNELARLAKKDEFIAGRIKDKGGLAIYHAYITVNYEKLVKTDRLYHMSNMLDRIYAVERYYERKRMEDMVYGGFEA